MLKDEKPGVQEWRNAMLTVGPWAFLVTVSQDLFPVFMETAWLALESRVEKKKWFVVVIYRDSFQAGITEHGSARDHRLDRAHHLRSLLFR